MSNSEISLTKGKQMINSLTGIKVIALLLLFIHHSSMPKLPFELGSRMCELLFVISGFLVGYNKYNKNESCSYKYSFDYVISKLIVFYPLHVIVTFLRGLIEFKTFTTVSAIIKFFLSLFLLSAWSPHEEVYFAYNGSSWFLSSLLFCYFLTPIFLRLIKVKKSYILFVLVLLVRLFLDVVTDYSLINYFALDTHVNPVIRSLEFFLGMLLVPTFLKARSFINNNWSKNKTRNIFSFCEITVLLLAFFSMYFLRNVMPKTFFIFLFSLFTFVFSFDYGLLSYLLGLQPFKLFNKIQFEFYLSHTTFLRYCKSFVSFLFSGGGPNIVISSLILLAEFFVLTFICFIYCKYIKSIFSLLMKKLVTTIEKVVLD